MVLVLRRCLRILSDINILMVNVSVNDVVNVHASCLSLSMSACRQRWIFLRIGFARCACADE